jgi:periplasmic divalent cation tolerance protein
MPQTPSTETLCVVLTTFADESSAAKVVRQLVEERLAACGTILPQARSIYRWNGQIEDGRETVVLFKTGRKAFPLFQKRLIELHPYETPEILSFEPTNFSASYAAWVLDSLA